MSQTDHKHSGHKSPALVAEQRMREWTLGLEVRERLETEPGHSPLPRPICPFISISRETGAGGGVVGQRVRDILGCDILDRGMLDEIAQRYKLPRDMLDFVDEKTSNWLLECFGKWISQQLVTQSEYVVHLGQIALMAAQHARTIFVGRGAHFLLPADRGLAIFLVAPLEMRIARIRGLFNYSVAEANKYIRETDEGRREFLRKHFNRKMGDPHLYDLVINRAHVGEEQAAELIAHQFRRRFPEA